MESLFSEVYKISLMPGNSSGEVPGTLTLSFGTPDMKDAVAFWTELVNYESFSKAIEIDFTGGDSLKLTLLIDKGKESLVLVSRAVKCDLDRARYFLKKHPANRELYLFMRLNEETIEDEIAIDPESVAAKGIKIGRWKGKS